MRINNIVEFFHFVRNNGLMNLSPDVSSFVRCMEEFSRLCTCDPEATKKAKVNQCRAIYAVFLSRAPQYKDILLSKVSDNSLILCVDGQVVCTLTR